MLDDARIAFAYLGFERECKKQWVADAEQTYSTILVEESIKIRMTEPQRHVEKAFNAPIREHQSKRENIQSVVAEATEKLAILDRDYKAELSAAYEVQHELSKELEDCRHKLSSAYDDLNSAKRSLDQWYSKAEGNWLGNGGKKLPKSAFFGQDLSDRDRYKARRDSAAYEVGRYKSERSRIASHLDEARAAVTSIKESRQKMFDLKKEGFNRLTVTSLINNGRHELLTIHEEVTRLAKAHDEYIHQSKMLLGIYELENEIERLRRDKESCVKAFDNEASVFERKAKHRAAWLAARGK